MHYSIEPRDRIYIKGYGFLPFAKNIGTHATKVVKSMSNKYSQKLLDSDKKSTTNAIKTASKGAIQKIAEATSDLNGNKIADKITTISKSHSKIDKNEIEIPKQKIHISRKKTTNY